MDKTTFTSKKFLTLGIALLVVLALLAALPAYGSSYIVVLMTAILMYVLMTVSWVIFSGPTGYMSLASAAFFGIGVYTAAVVGDALPLFLVVQSQRE